MKRCREAFEKALDAREAGGTLQEAAAAAGVHVATLCRWQARSRSLREALRDAESEARRMRCLAFLKGPHGRPRVPWSRVCPACGGEVSVRTAPGMLHFWRCDDWLRCGWASWRPPAPIDCPECGGPCLWSHSRKSIGCTRCRWRLGQKCE
jgi:hypothetical protein